MEFIGELERFFASSIYPNRVPIAVFLVVGLVVLAAVAQRRGWFAAARRHPGRTVAVAIAAVALLGPIAWYLGSPLFISTTVDEPPPVAAVGSADPNATSMQPSAPAEAPAPTIVTSAGPAAPTPMERRGTFRGADEFHFGEGTVRLIETAPGEATIRLEDFRVRNGPDLYVYLSPSTDGYAEGAVEVARLKADTGNQNYTLPPGTDVSSFRSVVIWCKQFSVLFATAALG